MLGDKYSATMRTISIGRFDISSLTGSRRDLTVFLEMLRVLRVVTNSCSGRLDDPGLDCKLTSDLHGLGAFLRVSAQFWRAEVVRSMVVGRRGTQLGSEIVRLVKSFVARLLFIQAAG